MQSIVGDVRPCQYLYNMQVEVLGSGLKLEISVRTIYELYIYLRFLKE